MMESTSVGIGWIEILVFLIGGGGFLGLPPGERDNALLKAAPQQSLVYVEWAGRGPGKVGAPGVDGFVADPEVHAFFQSIEKALAAEPNPDEEQNLVGRREAWRWIRELMAHPGCLYVTVTPSLQGNGFLNVVKPAEMLGRFQVVLISSAGKNATAILEGFNRVAGTQLTADPRMETAVSSSGHSLTVHRDGDRLLFGFGAGVVERAITALRGDPKGLESNPRFAGAWKRVATGRFGSAAWIDLRSVANESINSLGPAGLLVQAVLRGSGADALDYVVSGTGVADGTVLQRTLIGTSGRTDGILMLAASPAIQMGQLKHVPADCDLFAATSLNLGQVVTGARELVSKTTPLSAPVFDQAVKELEAELGLKLDADVFPAFGNVWTAFNSPSQGGIAGSSLIVTLEVRDHQKAKVVFEKLMQLLEQSLVSDSDPDGAGHHAELKQQEFFNHTISYVDHTNTDFGFTPSPSATPSFCLTQSHLLFAVHPQAMKAHLRYLASAQPGFDTVANRKLSLTDQQLLTATYMDGRRAAHVISSLAPYLGPVLLGSMLGNGPQLDVFAIPSAAALIPYAEDVTLSIARQKDGILLESKNPHIAGSMLSLLISARTWIQSEYSIYEEVRSKRRQPTNQVGLGAAEGTVVPAAAATSSKPQEKTSDVVTRKLVPLVIRAFVPEGVQPLIPNDIIDKLNTPPSPEVLQQREERRQRLLDRRRERLERRRVPVPLGSRPAPPAPPAPGVPNRPIPNPPPTTP